MKKIIAILLSVMLGTTFLVGCGNNQKKLDKQKNEIINQLKGSNGEVKEIKEGDIYNELDGVAQGSKAFNIINKDKKEQSIVIEMNIKESNKKSDIKNFISKCTKISVDLEKDLTDMNYKNLVILMDINNNFTGNSVSFINKNNEFKPEKTLIDESYSKAFDEAKKDK